MFLPVKRWLRKQGFQVFGEMPFPFSSAIIDVVARKDNDLICIEMKLCLSIKVIKQAALCQLITKQSYVGVNSNPRSLEQCRKLGLGALRTRGCYVDVLLEPTGLRKDRRMVYGPYRECMLEMCQRARQVGYQAVGGVACQAGIGPAIDIEAIIKSYRRKHPKATWREMYEKIPNHYASANSMRSAMDSNRQRRYIREHMKKAKAAV